MTRESPSQRARRIRADKFRAAQIAPRVRAPERCTCGSARIMHRNDGKCLTAGCGCTEYREASE